ncbi:MAG: efflux RND transporter periplasmic adaptor subunit [Candidatus Solibacter sp.]|nr:efflux RND transporter periplasmic adaptor subunit [Candidatus Solibacter sp.]
MAQVASRDVPIVKEWIATLDGRVNAEIRGQVTGYLLRQVYREGSFVRQGDPLFEVDARPFEAASNEAKGRLAQAESSVQQAAGNLAQNNARLGKAELDVKRYTPLAKTRAISQEEMDNALQSRLEAQAAVEASRAAVETAKASVAAARAAVYDAEVKLGFTRIASPIDGIAGLARVQVGDLVLPAGVPLTTVSTVDPIKAYFTISEQEYLAQQRLGGPDKWARNLELVLADGSVFNNKGAFFMADRQVDVGTGALRIAALFPNPGNVLRPGQFGRVRAVMGVRKDAAVVAQRAVTELQGSYQVAVVGDDNKVAIRSVRMAERTGSMWIVEEGLRPGERVIVEGLQKVRSGVVVNPKMAAAGAAGK